MENMLVTKSSQLPQISSAKVCGFQVFEKHPGPRQLSSAPPTSWSGSAQKALSPRGRSWEVRGQVKVILTLGRSLPTTWSSGCPDAGNRGPRTACTGDLLPRPQAASSPPHVSLMGLAWTYRWPGPGTPGPGGPLSVFTPRLGRAPPHPLQPFPRLCWPVAGLSLRLQVPDRSAHGYKAKSTGHLQVWPVGIDLR